MASCTTGQWASTAPQLKLTVSEKSSTATSVTYSWTLQYIASSAANTSTARAFTAVIDGATVYNSTYSIDGKKGTYTVKSGTKTINKGTSARTVSFSCTAAWKLTWSGTYCASKSASGSFSIAKKTSYTVSYNANGGSGAPSSQTKWHGTNLTLSSTVPTKSGYTFLGWSTSSTATSATYSAGASYTANAAATLYAIWRKTISLTYSANGGTGGPGTVSANVYNSTTTYTFTISSTAPTKSGYTFMGWSTANDTSVEKTAGNTYALSANATLYAVWRKTITVSYNVNGGSGTVAAQTGYAYNAATSTSITISSTKPTRTYYNFLGWSTASNASTATYKSGTAYSFSSNVTLYAVWELAYVKPRITDVSIVRCDDTGKAADDGTYALVNFNWATDQTVSSVQVTWENSVYTHTAASGTMGIISNLKLGDGTLSIENKYTFTITVTDSLGSTSISVTLPAMTFLLDFLNGGKGISFGKPANKEGFECEFPAIFNKSVTGMVEGLNGLVEIPASSNLNDYYIPGCYCVKNDTTAATITNMPIASSGRLIVTAALGQDISQITPWMYVKQKYIPYTGGSTTYERTIQTGETTTLTTSNWFPYLNSQNYSTYAYPKTGGTLSGSMVATGGDSWLGKWRMNGEWIGCYNAAANASATRKGWIGWDGGTHLNLTNEAGGYIRLAGNAYCTGHHYFGNGTTYYINSSGGANLQNIVANGVLQATGTTTLKGAVYLGGSTYYASTAGHIYIKTLHVANGNITIGTNGGDNTAGVIYNQMNMGTANAADSKRYYFNNNATGRFNALRYTSIAAISSARRYKENIEYKDINTWHDKLMEVKPCTYNYISGDDKRTKIGVIAEDLETCLPELVEYNEDGQCETVYYMDFVIPLVADAQYTDKRITELECKIAEQDEIIKSQDERIAKLESLVQQLLNQ